jgi:hypothetical protein
MDKCGEKKENERVGKLKYQLLRLVFNQKYVATHRFGYLLSLGALEQVFGATNDLEMGSTLQHRYSK